MEKRKALLSAAFAGLIAVSTFALNTVAHADHHEGEGKKAEGGKGGCSGHDGKEGCGSHEGKKGDHKKKKTGKGKKDAAHADGEKKAEEPAKAEEAKH